MERDSKQEIINLFENFLIENNIYSQFSTYLLEHSHITITDLSNYLSNYYGERNIIGEEFLYSTITFTLTKEGYIFWSEIDYKWNKVLKDYLKNSC